MINDPAREIIRKLKTQELGEKRLKEPSQRFQKLLDEVFKQNKQVVFKLDSKKLNDLQEFLKSLDKETTQAALVGADLKKIMERKWTLLTLQILKGGRVNIRQLPQVLEQEGGGFDRTNLEHQAILEEVLKNIMPFTKQGYLKFE